MKRTILIFLAFEILTGFISGANAQGKTNGRKIDCIVLDAGHGGHNYGAVGKNSLEKNITLAIALKAGKILNDSLENIKVIYTRTDDSFVELHKRAQIANQSNADLFISIHCNSSPSSVSFGTETFVMGLHKSNENLEVAKTENAAILAEDDYLSNYGGFDPNLDEDYIMLNMWQTVAIDNSLNLASLIQENLTFHTGLYDRGVKQAGFVVLSKITIPGVLVETGFLTNNSDEKYLIDPKNQDQIALAIVAAVLEFIKRIEEKTVPG